MSFKPVSSDKIAPAAGPFSAAAQTTTSLYLSGQVAQDPSTGKLIDGDIRAQAEQIFTNLRSVLEAAGKSLGDVVRVGVYLVDIGDFAAVNEVYARQFKAPYPARTCIGVAALPLGARVEIDLIAQ